MPRLVVRRLLQLVPILLVLSIVVFAWIRALPGGPATALLGPDQQDHPPTRLSALLTRDPPPAGRDPVPVRSEREAEAQACFRRAVEEADAQGALPLRKRAARSLTHRLRSA